MANKQDSKQKIMDTGLILFAKRGFAATGVREIAKEADVSLASMNYHFGSKDGLLIALIDQFFDGYAQVFDATLNCPGDVKQKLRFFIAGLIAFLRKNSDLARVAMLELSNDLPGTVKYRAEKINQLRTMTLSKMVDGDMKKSDQNKFITLAQAVLGSVFFHFIVKPMFEVMGDVPGKLEEVRFDDDFYKDFSNILPNFIMNGLSGVVDEKFLTMGG